MVFTLRLFFVLILLCSYPMVIMAKEIKYNHDSKTISEIQEEVIFKVLSPKRIPDDWTLDTKTSPWVMLHYMDSDDTKLMAGFDLRKGFRLFDDDFPHRQKVDINGNEGYFQEWDDNGEVDKNGEIITGGLLNWIQDGTSVEMFSSRLSKEQMIEIARSVN